ncbi:hypothetical protein H5410_045476 [Solanum commersonii]|uniref:Uncharacterized protein n=1 Tax=Solanum commersonii TaxID=4109 RepID=A0A9J5XB86_SOLCO|nr:hypothetical protein H5410_045476 [Solanum commersonii]
MLVYIPTELSYVGTYHLCEGNKMVICNEMIQEASSMTTSQSFIGVAFSSNIKCSFCLCEECEQQHDYFISCVKNSLIFLRK